MNCETYVMTVNVLVDTDKEIPAEFLSRRLEGVCTEYRCSVSLRGGVKYTLSIKEITELDLADFLEALKVL